MKRKVDSCDGDVKAIGVVTAFVAAFIVATLSGCGSLFGVREFEVWEGGPKWEFMEGQDFHIGMNGIDNVRDQRGVGPKSRGGGSGSAPSEDRY